MILIDETSPTSGDIAKTRQYINYIKAGYPTHVKLSFDDSPNNDIVFTDDDITANGGITVSTIMNSETDIKYGNVFSTEIVAYIYKSSKTDNVNWQNTMTLSFGVENGYGVVETWVKINQFFGDEPSKTTEDGIDVYQYVAHDIAYSVFDVPADDFLSNITFPIKIGVLFQHIASYVGFNYTIPTQIPAVNAINDIYIPSNPFKSGIKLRNIVSWIAEITRAYCMIYQTSNSPGWNKTAEMRTYKQQQIVYSLTSDEYYDIKMEDITVPTFDAVCSIDSLDPSNNDSYPSSYAGVPYNIVNNPILNSISQADRQTVLSTLQGLAFSYKPMNVTTIGNWLLEPGDFILVYEKDGLTSHSIPIFNRKLFWNGSCTDYYECTGNLVRQEMTEDEADEVYNDGRYVGKDQIGDAAECDVYNDIDQTSAGYVLDARQGKVLNDRITRVTTIRSLVTPQNATSAVTSVSTYGGRKFSDHHTLVFILRDNASSSTIRNAITIPTSIWQSGQVLYLIQNHGTNLENRSGITFTYESDTSIKVVTNGSAALTGFEIIGYFNPT